MNISKEILTGNRGMFEREMAPPALHGKIASSRFRPAENISDEISKNSELKRLYETAQEFQGIFVNMMLKSMRSTLHKESDPLYGGMKQDIFEDMLYDEYSKEMSRSGKFNIADEIYRQLSPAIKNNSAGEAARKLYEGNLPNPYLSSSKVKTFLR